MVLCSIEFLVFFLFVAAAYWTLISVPHGAFSRRPARCLGYVGRYCLAPAYAAGGWHGDAFHAAWEQLPFNGALVWIAAVVFFGTSMAWTYRPPPWPGLAPARRRFLFLHANCHSPGWPSDLCFHHSRLLQHSSTASRRLQGGRRRHPASTVAVSVTANLGLLSYFKYTNFFLGSLQALLHRCGAASSFHVLSILAPLGISFYTFEAINYIVDVYRGQVRTERNLANFMLFVLFFPHLIAGPIVRAREFLPQIRRRKRWDWMRVELGARFFLMGLFKKWFIADRMALFADPVFAFPSEYNGLAIWMAILAYALRIYGDFSGYTDMAIGTAHMLGFRLSKNFDMPYLAANVSEFWRCAGISLSTWLRDYLFIPAGR